VGTSGKESKWGRVKEDEYGLCNVYTYLYECITMKLVEIILSKHDGGEEE
jgi:hypothetical protein